MKKKLIAIFIMLQNNGFGPKKILISCMGSKVPFWQFFNFSISPIIFVLGLYESLKHLEG
jgi:hypothetical protein